MRPPDGDSRRRPRGRRPAAEGSSGSTRTPARSSGCTSLPRPAARARRALLEALEQRARELGYAIARLDTGDRQPAARRLYEGAGYRRIPAYNDNDLATYWYEKEL